MVKDELGVTMAGNALVRSMRYGVEGLALGIAALAAVPLIVFTSVGFGLLPIAGVGAVFLVAGLGLTRVYADAHRRWAGRVLGTEIERPYRSLPKGAWPRLRTVATDPATWRDFAWLWANGTAGITLGVLRFYLVFSLGYSFVLPWVWTSSGIGYTQFGVLPVVNQLTADLSPLAALLNLAIGVWANPKLRRAHAQMTAALLTPTDKAKLTNRVEHLTTSRADTVDARAAELRRIERDLHDGAQARLVALGMNLGMAAESFDRDPAAAKDLLTEARQSTSKALTELRDLVRGIHPPVLADRSLDGGVRALALDLPMPVDVDLELPARPDAPVESAMYFAVAETLTNVAKHADATGAWVRMRHDDGRLRVQVVDDGRGGAAMDGGTGLAGIRRRLAAFDGTLMVTSPLGGPTVVTMEVPCELTVPTAT